MSTMTKEIRERCLTAIRSNTMEDFLASIHEVENFVRAHSMTKLIVQIAWAYDVPFYCLLYNRPEMIASFREITQARCVNYFTNLKGVGGFMKAIAVATSLKYYSCTNELLALYGHDPRTPNEFDKNDLVNGVFSLVKSYGIDQETFRRVITGLCSDGLKLNSPADYGKAVMHDAVAIDFEIEYLKILFEVGCDINVQDKFAVTPFVMLCNRAQTRNFTSDYNMQTYVSKVKLFLYENPSVELTAKGRVSWQIHNFDKRVFEEVSQGTITEETAQALRLAPLLHLHGYDFSKLVHNCPVEKCREALETLFGSPKRLKDQCRIKLRRHFSGRAVHSFVNFFKMPTAIQDFILMKHELSQFA